MFRVLLCVALVSCCAALHDGSLRSSGAAQGFVKALEFKHSLRVCNAYPYAAALDVYQGAAHKLTSDAPMHYRTCKDFVSQLKSGDKLEFKVGDASAGTFAVSDLPQNDAVLLLVIHRHDTISTAVSFQSHIFANLENAEVVVMDAYKGKARSPINIKDVKDAAKGVHARAEELRYDSVVAINPGQYEVELMDAKGKAGAKTPFVALKKENYVIIRTGVEAQQGPAFPEELLIYPSSPLSALGGSSPMASISTVLLTLLIGLTQMW